MGQGIKYFLCFAAGAVAGGFIMKKITADKYEKLIDDRVNELVEQETASITEVFERDKEKFAEMRKDIEENGVEKERANINDYAKKVNSYGYSQMSQPMTNRYARYNDPNEPVIISPADYLDEAYDQYEREELTYYADGVLATTNGDEMITEQESHSTIGHQIFIHLRDHFGEYEDDPDTVHVRNDEIMMMYEILRDSRTYMEVTEE